MTRRATSSTLYCCMCWAELVFSVHIRMYRVISIEVKFDFKQTRALYSRVDGCSTFESCVRFRSGVRIPIGSTPFFQMSVGIVGLLCGEQFYFCFVALSLSLWLALPHTAGCPVQMKLCSPVFASLSLIRGS